MKRILLIVSVLFSSALLSSAQNNERMVVIKCENVAEADYEKMVRIASGFGATHFDCSQVEPSIWQWDMDRNDPYPCWSMHRATLFKYVLPSELEPYIPKDYVERNFKALQRHGQILNKYKMRGFMSVSDPSWLPEQAYRDHPECRGPRCDQARRARKEYYAPCIDDPGMRSMFVESVAKLCKAAPIDMIHILCNDSGSGLCWYSKLYPGANGPSHCKSISVEERALDFMDMWQEGASKAGIAEMRVNLSHTWGIDNIIPQLKPGQSLNGQTADGGLGFMEIGTGWRNDHLAPVFQMPRPVLVCRQLQKAQKSTAPLRINLKGPDDIDIIRLLDRYLYNPIGDGSQGCYTVLNEIASTFVGNDEASVLVDVWDAIENACELIAPYNTGGRLYDLGNVHQRWITRPFVAFPEKLEGEDLHYWRDFIFQAQGEEQAMDMLDLQGHRWLSGYGGFFLLRQTSLQMISLLSPCVAKVNKLEQSAVDKTAQKYLRGLSLRLQMTLCIIRNATYAVEFQWMMDENPVPEVAPHDETLRPHFQGDDELVRMNQLVREEIDNCYDMIRILNQADKEGIPVIIRVPKKFEQVLFLGEDLQDQLRRKIRIMEDHRRDFLAIWTSKNK